MSDHSNIRQFGLFKQPASGVLWLRRIIGKCFRTLKQKLDFALSPNLSVYETTPELNECDDLPKTVINACNLCESEEREILYQKLMGEHEYSAVICTNCGNIYLDKMAHEEWTESDGKHGGKFGDEVELTADYVEKQFTKYYEFAQLAIPFLEQYTGSIEKKSVLDLGCGPGGFVKAYADRGAVVTGLEASGYFAEFATKTKSLNIVKGGIEQLEQGRQYDLVSGIRYLNHFADPKALLEHIYPHIADGGYLFLELKDSAHDIRRKGPWDAIKPDHPVMFTEYSLASYLLTCGFEPLVIHKDLDGSHKFGTMNHLHCVAKKSGNEPGTVSYKNVYEKNKSAYLLAVSQFLHYKSIGIRS